MVTIERFKNQVPLKFLIKMPNKFHFDRNCGYPVRTLSVAQLQEAGLVSDLGAPTKLLILEKQGHNGQEIIVPGLVYRGDWDRRYQYPDIEVNTLCLSSALYARAAVVLHLLGPGLTESNSEYIQRSKQLEQRITFWE